MCNKNAAGSVAYINISLGANKGQKYIVVSIELLKALESFRICWLAYFRKNTANVHSFLNLMISGSLNLTGNYGIHADKDRQGIFYQIC
jgi:hypothetical protein